MKFVNGLLLFAAVIVVPQTVFAADAPWKARNDRAAEINHVTLAQRSDMENGVTPSMAPGGILRASEIPETDLAPGVKGRIYWGKGAMVNRMTMEPGSQTEREKLPSERIMVVEKGSVEQLVGGKFVRMSQYDEKTDWSATPHRDYIYLPRGSESQVRAGAEGAVVIEVFQPVHPGYIRKAGGASPPRVIPGSYQSPPSCPAGKVLDYYDVQFTDLSSGGSANSRLISASGVMCAFLSADPDRGVAVSSHPEEQLTIILRGTLTEPVMDSTVHHETGGYHLSAGNMGIGGLRQQGLRHARRVLAREARFPRQDEKTPRYAHRSFPPMQRWKLVHDGAAKEPKLNFPEGP